MFSTKPFNSIAELFAAFPTEQACIDHLEILRWNSNVVSPFNGESKVYKSKNNRYKCTATNKYFNVRTGTIFENSKISLQTWLLAIYFFTSSKRGISSYQMAEQLNITQKSAWFLLSRIRYAMEHETFLRFMNGIVESDETFVGGKNKNRHHDKKVENSQGRSFKDKTPVLGLLERGEYEIIERPNKNDSSKMVKEKVVTKTSRVMCTVVPDTKAASIQPFINQNVEIGSRLMSDEWMGYNGLNKNFEHSIVDHGRGQYVNEDTSTNGIENFWSHLKRAIIGTTTK